VENLARMSLPPTYVKDFHYEDHVKRMEYNQLGQTHMKVSKISIGGATLCSSFYGQLDFEEAKRTVHEALKRGINYIDTAPFYGQGESESNVGKILKDVPRQAYYIATKTCRYDRTGPNQFDFSFDRTMRSVDESLERLSVDYIDLYQLHDVEFADSIDEVLSGAFEACLELRKQGKIRAIGINGYPLSVLKEGLIKGEGKFDTVLTYARYTLFDDSLLDYLPLFNELKIGIIAASAQGCGALCTRGPPAWHPGTESLKAIVAEAADVCRKNNVELAKLATHHLLHVPGQVGTFLMGMEKLEYLNHNMSAYHDGLTPKEAEIYENLMKT
jgi:L-galactose dehydrogenase